MGRAFKSTKKCLQSSQNKPVANDKTGIMLNAKLSAIQSQLIPALS